MSIITVSGNGSVNTLWGVASSSSSEQIKFISSDFPNLLLEVSEPTPSFAEFSREFPMADLAAAQTYETTFYDELYTEETRVLGCSTEGLSLYIVQTDKLTSVVYLYFNRENPSSLKKLTQLGVTPSNWELFRGHCKLSNSGSNVLFIEALKLCDLPWDPSDVNRVVGNIINQGGIYLLQETKKILIAELIAQMKETEITMNATSQNGVNILLGRLEPISSPFRVFRPINPKTYSNAIPLGPGLPINPTLIEQDRQLGNIQTFEKWLTPTQMNPVEEEKTFYEELSNTELFSRGNTCSTPEGDFSFFFVQSPLGAFVKLFLFFTPEKPFFRQFIQRLGVNLSDWEVYRGHCKINSIETVSKFFTHLTTACVLDWPAEDVNVFRQSISRLKNQSQPTSSSSPTKKEPLTPLTDEQVMALARERSLRDPTPCAAIQDLSEHKEAEGPSETELIETELLNQAIKLSLSNGTTEEEWSEDDDQPVRWHTEE